MMIQNAQLKNPEQIVRTMKRVEFVTCKMLLKVSDSAMIETVYIKLIKKNLINYTIELWITSTNTKVTI